MSCAQSRERLRSNHCELGGDNSIITPEIAKKFFEACETGKGWEGCKAYCQTDATFSAQTEPLAGVKNLQQYADWMKGLLTLMPDGRYELKSFGTDDAAEERLCVRRLPWHSYWPGWPLPSLLARVCRQTMCM